MTSRADARPLRWFALAAATALAACGRGGGDGAPALRAVEPAEGTEGAPAAIRIVGGGLEPHVLTDYGEAGGSAVDDRFQAWLGAARLRDVRPSGDGALLATVPEDLPAGTYDLAVADPAGKRATLAAAFLVRSPADTAARVASFRFDAVPAQVAGAPFTITVAALDLDGQVVKGFSGTAAISDRAGALVPSTIGPFAWGVWTGPVEVRAARAADALSAADALGHSGSSNDFDVLPAPAARLAFASPPVDALAGACAGPVTVALEDLYGAPTAATAPLDVAFAGAVEVWADPACAVAAPGATVPAGASAASVWVRSTLAAPFTLRASAAGVDPAAQPGVVRPAAPARLVFTSAPQTVTAGACSAAATVRAEDAWGNVTAPASDTPVALSSSAGGFAFHAAAGCGAAPVAAVTLAARASTAAFWFRGTSAGPAPVIAAGAGVAGAATQAETVAPAAAVSLAFVTASQTVPAGSCSGAATVEARDAFGNAAPVPASTAVSLAAAPAASFGFHLDPACAGAPVAATSIAAGAATATFRFRATAAGRYDVTASGAGLPGAATQPEVVGAATAIRLAFTTAPRTVTAGQCSGALTVEVRDGLGNAAPVAATTPVALAASPAAGVLLFGTPDCSGPAGGSASIAAGSATATFSLRATAAGTLDASATAAGLVPATQAETVVPAAPDRLVFTSAPQTATAGACSAAASLEARDAYGNVAPVAALTSVALSAAPGADFALFAAAGCAGAPVLAIDLAAGASGLRFWFRGTAAGAVTVTATGSGIAAPASQAETVSPAAPAAVAFTSSPQVLTAGSCSGTARVELRDNFGNATADAGSATALDLSATPASGFQLFEDPGCAVPVPGASLAIPAGGTGKDFWFRGTVTGSVTLTSAPSGLVPASQAETIQPAAPASIAFQSAPVSAVAGACSAVLTVVSEDAYGNVSPVTGATAVSLAAAPAASFAFHDAAGCGGAPVTSATIAAGSSSASFRFRGSVAGTVTVTASALSSSPTQPEIISAAAPDHLAFTTAAQAVTAGACSGVATVQVRDLHDNVATVAGATTVSLAAAPAAGFQLFAAADCGGGAVGSVTIAAGGSGASFWFRGTAAGAVGVTATGTGIPGPATQAETISPAAPDHLAFTAAAQTVTAGACSSATVEVRDLHDNVATVAGATTVSLAAAPPTQFQLFGSAGCGGGTVASVTIAAGGSGASFWFLGTAAGTVTVTASGLGSPDATQAETIQPAATSRFRWDAIASPEVEAVPFAVTVRAQDAHGNPTPSFTGTATLSAPPGTALSCASGCSAGTVTVPFVAGVWSGQVALAPPVSGVWLTATSGAIAGDSGAFDVVSGVFYEVGSFVKSTGAAPAAQTVSHALGTTPKAIVLWTAGQTLLTPQVHFRYAQGFSDGTTSASFGSASEGGVATTNVSRRVARKALTIVQWGEALQAEADLTGWDATSFALSWTANDTRPVVIHYLLVGGPSVSAKVVNWQMPTAAGTKVVTGVGFRPDLVLHAHGGYGLTGAPPSSANHAAQSMGAMNAAGEQWAFTALEVDGLPFSLTQRAQRTDRALVAITSPPSIVVQGSWASMDPDGFTMTFSGANGNAGQVASLALAGVRSRVGSFAKTTAAGAQVVTGVGFQPSAVLLTGFDAPANTGALAETRFLLGASDGSIQATSGFLDVNGAGTTSTWGVDRTDKVLCSPTSAGGILAESDLSGFLADGLDLGWTTNAAPASQLLYVALGKP